MRTVLLIIPELGEGGAERSISKLSVQLSKHFKVIICTFHDQFKQRYDVGGEVVCLFEGKPAGLFGKLKAWRQRRKKLRALKLEHNPVASISFLEGANYLNVLTKNGNTILSVRGSKVHDKEIAGLSGWVRKHIFIPRWYKRADSIVCVSEGIKNEMASFFKLPSSKLKTIHNFYDIQGMRNRAEESLSPEESALFSIPVISNVGRYHVQKEQRGMMRVFALVRKELDCRLLLIGDGPMRASLLQYGRELGLKISEGMDPEADVCLVGYHDNPLKLIRQSRLFVLSSSWEGFPNALAEAMITGTPCVSTDCETGPRELFGVSVGEKFSAYPHRTQYGTLLPLLSMENDSVDQLWSGVLLDYLSQDKSEEGARASERMLDFSAEHIVKKWEALINRS